MQKLNADGKLFIVWQKLVLSTFLMSFYIKFKWLQRQVINTLIKMLLAYFLITVFKGKNVAWQN